MEKVQIFSRGGVLLDPTTRCGHVRLLLKEGKAKVLGTHPFTIQLLYDTEDVLIRPGGREHIERPVATILRGQPETHKEALPVERRTGRNHTMAIKTYPIKVRLTFLEEVLGTGSSKPDIHAQYIASKAPDAMSTEEEVAAYGVEEVIEKDMTIFPRTADGRPFLYDYQVKGFFKDACSMLNRLAPKNPVTKKKEPANESSKLTAFKKIIDGNIFVEPRQIPFEFEGEMGNCQRPLRAQTAQGDRVALANSETVPAGTTVEFTIVCLSPEYHDAVREWLDYGQFRGLNQWRNSGKGKFTWEELPLDEAEEDKPKKGRKSA